MFISVQLQSLFCLHSCYGYSCSVIHLHTESYEYVALYLCGSGVKACNNGRQLQRLVPYLDQSWHNITQTVGLTFLPLAALSTVYFIKRDALPNYEIMSIIYSKGLAWSALSTWLVTAVGAGWPKTFHDLHRVHLLIFHILTKKRHKLRHITKRTSY
jgi:hypothetical protein